MTDTFKDGVEAAARWHDHMAALHRAVQGSLPKEGLEVFDALGGASEEAAEMHELSAAAIRALRPPSPAQEEREELLVLIADHFGGIEPLPDSALADAILAAGWRRGR